MVGDDGTCLQDVVNYSYVIMSTSASKLNEQWDSDSDDDWEAADTGLDTIEQNKEAAAEKALSAPAAPQVIIQE